MIETALAAVIPAGLTAYVPKQPKIFLPLLDNGNGQVMASFMIDFFEAFRDREVTLIRASDSHANRGMNKIANDFLASDCDVWINIDADIRFRKLDVDQILEHDLTLVYGIYPKKEDAANPCLGTFDDVAQESENPLVEVRRCGRGFMLVKREVLEAMKEDNGGPALRYHNHDRVEWDFFPSGPVLGAMSFFASAKRAPKPCEIQYPLDEAGYPKREWLSEDWYFCERARQLGIRTFVDSRIALGHVGTKEYRFNPGQIARMDYNIKSWQEIHGWFDYENFYRDLAKALAASASENGSSRFVEVGSWLGRSIAAMWEFLGAGSPPSQDSIELHAVDTFCSAPENEMQRVYLTAHGGNVEKAFRANMEALGVKVNVHAKPSVHASQEFEDGSIDAAFIDGNHHELAVAADIEAWFPKIKQGGILSGHDIDEPGVANAVNKFFAGKTKIEVFGRCWFVRL